MRIPRIDFDLVLKRDLASVKEKPSFQKVSSKTLFIITPSQLPSWSVVCQSSHSKKDSIRWLICKDGLLGLNKNERTLLQISSSDAPESVYLLIKTLSRFEKNVKLKKVLLEGLIEQGWNFLPLDPKSYIRTYEPQVEFFKIWTTPKRFPPRSYIGKGHNDTGSLSGTLAWQEVQSYTEEEISKDSEIIQYLELILNPPKSVAGSWHKESA